MKSKLLILLSLFAFVGGAKAQTTYTATLSKSSKKQFLQKTGALVSFSITNLGDYKDKTNTVLIGTRHCEGYEVSGGVSSVVTWTVTPGYLINITKVEFSGGCSSNSATVRSVDLSTSVNSAKESQSFSGNDTKTITIQGDSYFKNIGNKGFVTIGHGDTNMYIQSVTITYYTTPITEVSTNPLEWVAPQGDGPAYKPGTTDVIETYSKSNYTTGKVLYQKLVNKDNGYYKLTFNAVASKANISDITSGDGIAQIYVTTATETQTTDMKVWVQDDVNSKNDSWKHSYVVHVTDGTLEYGIQNVAAGGNWYVCTSPVLEYLGDTKANLKCKKESYSTFVAPFAVSIPEDLTAYKVSDVKNGWVLLTEVDDEIPANTPVIIQNGGEMVEENYYHDANVSKKDGYLIGIYSADDDVPADAWVLQDQGQGQKFYKVAKAFKGTPNRCYLNPDYQSGEQSQGVNAFSLSFDDVDAIEAIDALTKNDAKIYDVNGRQLSRLQKGINIVNGKKIMVK